MTPLERCVANCTGAGLSVLGAATVGKLVCVTVKQKGVPQSASGLDGLAKRLGTGFMSSYGDGDGTVKLWFMAED